MTDGIEFSETCSCGAAFSVKDWSKDVGPHAKNEYENWMARHAETCGIMRRQWKWYVARSKE